MFLAALLVKVEVASEDASDAALFDTFLVLILLAGPLFIAWQLAAGKVFFVLGLLHAALAPKKKKSKKSSRKSATEVELAFSSNLQSQDGSPALVIENMAMVDGKMTAMAAQCECGNIYKGDSRFCRNCGTKRLTAEEVKMASGDADSTASEEKDALAPMKGESKKETDAHKTTEAPPKRSSSSRSNTRPREPVKKPSPPLRSLQMASSQETI